jgi:hypothetical protein
MFYFSTSMTKCFWHSLFGLLFLFLAISPSYADVLKCDFTSKEENRFSLILDIERFVPSNSEEMEQTATQVVEAALDTNQRPNLFNMKLTDETSFGTVSFVAISHKHNSFLKSLSEMDISGPSVAFVQDMSGFGIANFHSAFMLFSGSNDAIFVHAGTSGIATVAVLKSSGEVFRAECEQSKQSFNNTKESTVRLASAQIDSQKAYLDCKENKAPKLGYKDIKIGMCAKDILALNVCNKYNRPLPSPTGDNQAVASFFAYNQYDVKCYDKYDFVFYFGNDATEQSEMLFNKIAGQDKYAVSAKRLRTLKLKIGEATPATFGEVHQQLSERYKNDWKFSQSQLEQFNYTDNLKRIGASYGNGTVFLYMEKRKDPANKYITLKELFIIYTVKERSSKSKFYQDMNPKKKSEF